MKSYWWFGWITVPERARNDIEQLERDLYDAEKNLALQHSQVEHYRSEILRLQQKIDLDSSVGIK